MCDKCDTCDASGPKDIEGNVAQALAKHQADCGFTDKHMWEVLQTNLGRIHSYAQFVALSNCKAPPKPTTSPTPTVPLPIVPIIEEPEPPVATGVCATKPGLRRGAAGTSVRELQVCDFNL